MGDISTNFSFKEFTYSDSAGVHAALTDHNTFLLKCLVLDIMQPIRDKWGKLIPTSGIRDKVIIDALKAAGYPVSLTTDHSYGDPEVNAYGVGACDFVPEEADVWEVFEWIINSDLYPPYGQVIIYPDPDDNPLTNDAFIHISNRKNVVFTSMFLMALGLDKSNKPPNAKLVYRKSWPDYDGKYRPYEGVRI